MKILNNLNNQLTNEIDILNEKITTYENEKDTKSTKIGV